MDLRCVDMLLRRSRVSEEDIHLRGLLHGLKGPEVVVAQDLVVVGIGDLARSTQRFGALGLGPLQALVLPAGVEPDSIFVAWLALVLGIEPQQRHRRLILRLLIARRPIAAPEAYLATRLLHRRLQALAPQLGFHLLQPARLLLIDEAHRLNPASDVPAKILAHITVWPGDLSVLARTTFCGMQDLVSIVIDPNLEAFPIVFTHGHSVAVDALFLLLLLHELAITPSGPRANDKVPAHRWVCLLLCATRPPGDRPPQWLRLPCLRGLAAAEDLMHARARRAEAGNSNKLHALPSLENLGHDAVPLTELLPLIHGQTGEVHQLAEMENGAVQGSLQEGTSTGQAHKAVHRSEAPISGLASVERHRLCGVLFLCAQRPKHLAELD
mmetsp:Transcript_19889/g.43322  ORF Transcript_19889/g.43322 Transcript_19889/m.43322 type:complete len:383 (+) Transcript_19889:638-1786(+)